jgi:hypothetical protein
MVTTTVGNSSSAQRDLKKQLIELANAQFTSPEYQRLFKARFTAEGAKAYWVQHAHFNLNRRDVWGFVQGASPMDIKKMVWEHEEDELAGSRERQVADHFTLVIKQGAAFGLTADDFWNTPQMDTTFACAQGWLNLARTCPWLEGFATASCLELSNNEELIRGGCISRRIGEKCRDELGVPMRKQYSNAEHVVADVEHGSMLLQVVDIYGDTGEGRAQILSGAKKSWAIERVFRGFTGIILEEYAAKAA